MNEDRAPGNYHIRSKLQLCLSFFGRVGYVSSQEGSIDPFPASHVRNREKVEVTQVEGTAVQYHPSKLLFAMMAGRLAKFGFWL